MWREKIEAFWDGDDTLVLGFFGARDLVELFGQPSQLLVVSCADPEFQLGAILLDAIDVSGASSRHWVVRLPRGHRYVLLRSHDIQELRLFLIGDTDASAGDWRLLMTELAPAGKGGEFFRVAWVAARAEGERFAREQVERVGDRLVWAVRQQRSADREGNATVSIHVTPSRRVWPPRESRITIEPVEVTRERPRNPPKVGFAVLDHWFREKPVPVVLRIRIVSSGSGAESQLDRIVLVHLMHQRRYLSKWIRDKRISGDPIIEPLTFEDIRTAVGVPDEMPDAVEAPEWITVLPLSEVLAAPDETEFDGFSVRHGQRQGAKAGTIVTDVEFFGATLGDDIGLASNSADPGDIIIQHADPGGSSKVRLLRVGIEGLAPIALDNSEMLDEILARAAESESRSSDHRSDTSSSGRPAAALQDRQAAFVESIRKQIRNPALASTLDAKAQWEDLSPQVVAAFAAVVGTGNRAADDAVQRLGAYGGFRADPALVGAVARRPDLIADVANEVLSRHHDVSGHLAHRLAAARGVPDMVMRVPELPLQVETWQLIGEHGLAQQLENLRVSVGGTSASSGTVHTIIATLSDIDAVERAANSWEDLEEPEDAEQLRAYLRRRRSGHWTPIAEASALVRLVAETPQDQMPIAPAQREPTTEADNRRPPELRAAIEGHFQRARHLASIPTGLADLERVYLERMKNAKVTRYDLAKLESRILELIEQPAEDERINRVIAGLEGWADLPDFLRTIEPRLARTGRTASSKQLELLTAYVNRTYASVPRRSGGGTAFDRCRDELAGRIGDALASDKRGSGRQSDAVKDITAFGDILLFHQAYRAIDEVLPMLSDLKPGLREIRRVQDGLGQWPRRAAQTWEEVASVARSYFPPGLDRLQTRVSPPDLQGREPA
jgi:hypothetical protein